MTTLEEIKDVATASAQAAERAAQQISRDSTPGSENALREFHNTLLNLRAELLAVYKVAVLEARRTDSPEEITSIWREILRFCQGMQAMWQDVFAFDPVTQGLLDEYRKQLAQLQAVALEHFQFHNGLE
jgi:hypothetical protein